MTSVTKPRPFILVVTFAVPQDEHIWFGQAWIFLFAYPEFLNSAFETQASLLLPGLLLEPDEVFLFPALLLTVIGRSSVCPSAVHLSADGQSSVSWVLNKVVMEFSFTGLTHMF